MAEKEERILITKCSGWCHAHRMSCDPFDDKDGMYCDKSGKWVRITEKECAKCKDQVLLGISRQEAIEKIAKALYETDYQIGQEGSFTISANSIDDIYKKSAEAALNALLGGK